MKSGTSPAAGPTPAEAGAVAGTAKGELATALWISYNDVQTNGLWVAYNDSSILGYWCAPHSMPPLGSTMALECACICGHLLHTTVALDYACSMPNRLRFTGT